jgi:hypothetical protein
MVTLAIGIVLLVAGPAAAGQYPEPSLSAEYQGNGVFRVTGTGCQPSEAVTITVDPGEGTATGAADAEGAFTIDVFAGRKPGTYAITAVCGDLSQTIAVEVEGADNGNGNGQGNGNGGGGPGGGPGQTPANKPVASDTTVPLFRAGSLLAMIGGLFFYAASKRRQRLAV